MNEEKTITENGVDISVIPVWKWLLLGKKESE